ncbi:MAG TPA: cupin domain-containing protein [Mycobacterium sp.]|nr:cupin domain-containing protein [Mycobacterium sp.]
MKSVRWFALITPVTLAAVFAPAPASATPPVGVEAVVISQATVEGVDYITRRLTVQPGGSTGWHYHDGRVFGVIREGTLTRTMADCSEVVSPMGSAVTEESGPNHAHVGRNLGPVPVVAWVVHIAPAGTPWSVDVPSPGCGIP